MTIQHYQPRLHPLTRAEMEELDTLLMRGVGAGFNIEGVHGFITAIACSREWVPPDECLDFLFGGDFELDTQEQADFVIRALMRMFLKVSEELLEASESDHIPDLLLLEDGNGQVYGNDWARGFLAGTRENLHWWKPVLREEGELVGLIIPIFALARENDPDPELRSGPYGPEKREEILAILVASIIKLHTYFEPDRLALLAENLDEDSLPIIRTFPKIGRKEPCPCGSGRKYKHCLQALLYQRD